MQRPLSLAGRVSFEAILIATIIMWALGFTTARYAVTHGFEPLQYSAPRFALGALIFVIVELLREGTLRFERRDLPYIVPAALLGVLINQLAFNYAVKFASASTVAIVFRDAADLQSDSGCGNRLGANPRQALDCHGRVVRRRRARRDRIWSRPERWPRWDPACARGVADLCCVLGLDWGR